MIESTVIGHDLHDGGVPCRLRVGVVERLARHRERQAGDDPVLMEKIEHFGGEDLLEIGRAQPGLRHCRGIDEDLHRRTAPGQDIGLKTRGISITKIVRP
jgi:hypothetical protein